MSHQDYNPNHKGLARALRGRMTKAEASLWKYGLKASNLGVAFKRQRPIDKYIADFVCLPLKLIVEIDGLTHEYTEVQENDKIRERRLQELGYYIIRFSDSEVLNDINAVLGRLSEVILELRKSE